MLASWSLYDKSLCILIPKLQEAGALSAKHNEQLSESLGANSPIITSAFETFKRLEDSLNTSTSASEGATVAQAWGYLSLMNSLPLPADATAITSRVHELLTSISVSTPSKCLAPLAGKALGIMGASGALTLQTSCLLPLISAYYDNAVFLQGLFDCLKQSRVPIFSKDEQETICDSLVLNLSSASHEVRRLSISLIDKLPNILGDEGEDSINVMHTLGLVEDTPFIISNQRNLSMYVRKLGMEYPHLGTNRRERRIVPAYLFGKRDLKPPTSFRTTDFSV